MNRAEIRSAIEALDASAENFGSELTRLENEYRKLEMLERSATPEPKPEPEPEPEPIPTIDPETDESVSRREQNAQKMQRHKTPGIVTTGAGPETNDMKHRKAFMEYVCRGVEMQKEYRADATSTTTIVGALIPTTLMSEIIKQVKVYGQLYSRVRKLNVQGGVEFPIGDVIPTATWITETTVSDTKATTINTKVSFGYHVLELRLAQTLLSTVTTLAVFETEITNLLVEGMVMALDMAIMSGSGSGQPTGILNDTRVPTANKIAMLETDFTWKGWKAVFAKCPLSSRGVGVIVTTNANWETHMDGMVDANGQPVARTTYGIDGTAQLRFMGREVLLVENTIISDFDSASEDDEFAVILPLEDYAINSSLAMTYKRYFDEDTNKWISKGLVICDGKLLKTDLTFILTKAVPDED